MIFPIWEPTKRGASRVCGFINESGQIVFGCNFAGAWPSSEGMAEVSLRGKCGFINEEGNIAIPLIFDSSEAFSEGRAAVEKRGRFGHTDRTGRMMYPAISVSYVDSFSDGLAIVRDGDDRIGFIDIEGRVRIPPLYASAREFVDSLAPVATGDGWKIIDRENRSVAEFDQSVELAHALSEGYFVVSRGEFGFTYADTRGKIQGGHYLQAASFSEGLAAIRTHEGKHGYIDTSFNILFLIGDQLGGMFHRGRAVTGNGLVGVVDRSGTWVVKPRFKSLTSFRQGLALFQTEKTIGYLSPDGDVRWEGPWCDLPHWIARPF